MNLLALMKNILQVSPNVYPCTFKVKLYTRGVKKAVIFDLNGVFVEEEGDEISALARELKAKGFKLFILSNNMDERTAYYDAHFPVLKELFDKQYFSWQTGFIKPDRRAFELLLTENNLKPEECVYFDDSSRNVAAAKNLGIESYMFESPAQVRQLLL